MSIKSKLSCACLLFILINVLVGVFFQRSEQRTAALGIDIYDRAFMAMSYLRSSQNGLSRLHALTEHGPAEPGSELGAAMSRPGAATMDGAAAIDILLDGLSDVEVAHDRAMSDEGAKATRALADRLKGLQTELQSRSLRSIRGEVESIQDAFDTAVELYAGDGYLYRRKVQDLVDHSFRDTWITIAVSVAVAAFIMLILWASIVPPLRSAVAIARAISAGKLDSNYRIKGSDETAILLRTLLTMQDSLVDKIARIDTLAIEARSRAAELTVQNGRFQAALDNMHHGLCLVDASYRLVVANHRFTDMFGLSPGPGSDLTIWPLFPKLGECFRDGAPKTEELPEGRVIRIVCQPVEDGGWVVTFEDVTERHRAEADLVRMARHDALTGLPNRALFRDSLLSILGDADLAGPTVLYVDLDGFKSINDTMGHDVGDELLRGVAKRLQGCVTRSELVARLGGDEFGIILLSGEEAKAQQRATAILEAMREPFDLARHRVTIGASVGIAVRRPGAASGDLDLGTTLLKNADVALYRAKAEGKGLYRFHSEELDAAASERRSLEADLRNALEKQEFSLVFQPIVAADGTGVHAFEALLRWQHPQRGAVSPMTFIPIAEETGLILPIGRWVLRAACAEAAKWPCDVKVAVNLSAVQFRQGFLGADIIRALADANLAPQRLELEITESVLIHDSDPVIATLMQLRSLGVRIALDDFGTGYSSLSYLRMFPFDKLKIDKSFVQNLADAGNLAILKAMTGLGPALNVAVVAEGVETAEQADQLAREGCSQFQGYYFGRPGPALGVPEVIQRLSADVKLEARLVG